MIGNFFKAVGKFVWNKIQQIGWAGGFNLKNAFFVYTTAVGVKGFLQAKEMLAKGQDIMANKTAAGGKIPVIYGTRRVGAQIVYMDTAQNRSKDLFVVYAISVGECEEILGRTIEIDGNSILDGNIYKGGGYVGSDKISSGNGSLNTASQVGDNQYSSAGNLGTNPALRYSFVFNLHHGASSQTADPMLRASIPTEWTANHKLNGICYIAASFDYDKKGMYKGVPQITVQVKGKKVFDPRDSSTKWSSNPALCFLDYIQNDEYGKGLATSQINMTTISAAATACEVEVDQPYYNDTYQDLTWSGTAGNDFIVINDNDDWWQNKVDEVIDIRDSNDASIFSNAVSITGSTRYQYYDSVQENRLYIDDVLANSYTNEAGNARAKVKRFHCNGYIDTNKNVMDNAKELLANMRGIFLYIDGKYELQIEDTGTSTFSITDDHIIADAGISVDYGNKDKKANKVVIEFFNANKKYELDTATVLHDASPEYYSDDGEVLEVKAEFPYVTDPYIAYNMGKAILTRSRNQTTMQFLGTPEMYKLNVGDIVNLTYLPLSFSGKVCRVEALELQANGLVSVSLIEYFDVYTWEVPAQEPVEIIAHPPSIGALHPPEASSIVFTDTDASSINRPTLTWTEPTDFPVRQYRVDVVDTANPPVQVFSKLVDTNSVDLSFLAVGNYNANITSFNGVGIESNAVVKSFTIGNPPTATADIQDDAVTNVKVNDLSADKIDTGVLNLGSESGMAVRQTKTGYTSTATGFWLGNDGGTPKFNIGTSTNYLQFDGSNLQISGNISATSLNVTNATVTGTLDASVITVNGEVLSTLVAYGSVPDQTGNWTKFTDQVAFINNVDFEDAVVFNETAGFFEPTTFGDNIDLQGELKVNGAIEVVSNTPSTTTNKLYNSSGSLYWNGQALGTGTGDITAVVAGTNLNGGGTSGSVTLNLDSTITGNHTFSNNLIIGGDLTVQGTTTTVNTDDLNVKDKNITLNYSTGDSSASANGAGITIQDAVSATQDATLTWNTSSDRFNFSHGLDFPDSTLLVFGDGDDLRILHNGTNSVFSNYTGNLDFKNFADDTDIRFWSDDGSGSSAIYFRLDGSQATASQLITRWDDNSRIALGSSNDLQLYHDGSHSYIYDGGVGDLKLQATNLLLEATDGTNYIHCADDGAVRLYYNGFTKLATTSSGVDISGTLTSDGLTVDGTIDVNTTSITGIAIDSTNNGSQISFESIVSSVPWNVGISGDTTEDFVVYQSGSGSGAIKLYTDGDTRLQIANNGDISFYEDTGTTAKLFWDASAERLGIGNTAPTQALDVTGTVTADGLVVSSATANVADLRRANNTGAGQILLGNSDGYVRLSGTNGSFDVFNANNTAQRFGVANNGDISFYDDTGSQGLFWDASTGDLAVEGTIELGNNYIIPNTNGTAGQVLKYPTAGSSTLVWSDIDTGAVTSISNNANNRILTATGGTTINGESGLTFDGATLGVVGDISLGDNKKIYLGTGNDTEIYFNGSNSYFIGTGNTFYTGATSVTLASGVSVGSQTYLTADYSNGVKLYHTGAIKAKSTATGFDVTGTVTSDDTVISGSNPTLTIYETDTTNLNTRFDNGGGDLYIQTVNDDGSNAKTRMLIDHATGDINLGYEDTGTTAKLFWDASAESFGIGLTNPSAKLDVQQATAGNIISAEFDNTDYTANNRNAIKIRQQVSSSGSYSAYLGSDKNTGNVFLSNDSITANHLVINTSGNVGIGTDSPERPLHIASSTPYIVFDETDTSQKFSMGSGGGKFFLYDETDSAQRLTVDTSGNVGIGVTSPTQKLYVKESGASTIVGIFESVSSGSYLSLEDSTTTTNSVRVGAIGNNFVARAGGSERLRIDSSGNLLVGKTSTSSTTVGAEIRPEGRIFGTTNNNFALLLNRTGTDGTITEFRKDGSTVGSIGTGAGVLGIGQGTGNLGFFNATVVPMSNVSGGASNGLVDLGTGNRRFKDLHLSGSAFIDTQTRLGSGSATTPAYSFSADSDSGIFRATTNALGFTTGGTERLRIDSSGRVGINTDSPKSLLNVTGTGADGGILTLENDSTSLVTDRKVGQIHFYSNDGSTNGAGVKADIKAIAENSIGSEIGLAFGTSGTGSATAVEAMRIDSSGRLNMMSSAGASPVLYHGNDLTSTSPTTNLSFGNEQNGALLIYTNSTERLRIDSSGRVGIGTSSLSKELTIAGTAPMLRLQENSASSKRLDISISSSAVGIIGANQSASALAFETTGSERLRINSAGNVGIGTDSPSAVLTVDGTTKTFGDSGITLKRTGSVTGEADIILAGVSGSEALSFRVNNSEKFRVQNNGYFGIGTDSPSQMLELSANNGAGAINVLRFNDSDTAVAGGQTTGRIEFAENDGANTTVSAFLEVETVATAGGGIMTFGTGTAGVTASEKMRLDHSGNLLVGKTSSSTGVAGARFSANGFSNITRDGGECFNLNRLTSDGTIIDFRKDSATVGVIGTQGGRLTIGSDDTHIFFDSGDTPSIRPHSGTASTNGVIDIGESGTRFKDLYLSGTISSGAITSTGAVLIDVDNQANGALRIVANQTNPNNDFYFAQEIISTLSGTTATTADREQGGLYLDINSTATGGDTSNEHRAYGVFVDLDSTGDADVIVGGYFNATATPSTGQTTEIIGVQTIAEDNGGAGNVTNVFGAKFQAQSDNATSDANNLYGSYNRVTNTADSGAITKAIGVYGEIDIAANSGDIYGTSYVFNAEYDNNTDSAPTHTAALFFGNYSGTLPTNPYGVYIPDAVRNRFDGSITTGRNSTTTAAYGFNSDLNTGMYSPADHQIGFLTSGGQRLKITSATAEFSTDIELTGTITSGAITSTGDIKSDKFAGASYPNNSFLDLDDDNGVGSTTNNTTLASIGNMNFIIDSNSNVGTDKFHWLKDNTAPNSATALMDLDKNANLVLRNGTVTGQSGGFFGGDLEVYNSSDLIIGSGGEIKYGTTVVIDSSRNLTNIGTISSLVNANRFLKYRSGSIADFEVSSDNNSNTVMTVTGTGTADIFKVRDNTNNVFTIADGGNAEFSGNVEMASFLSTGNATVEGTFTSEGLFTTDSKAQIEGSKGSATDAIATIKNKSTTNEGRYLQFLSSIGTNIGQIGHVDQTESNFFISTFGTGLKFESYITYKAVLPCNENGADSDNAIDLGSSSVRFDDVYATNGTIQTSDRNEKQDIQALTDAEQRVATACKGLIRRFRWQDSVAVKDNNPDSDETARYHFGVIAQDLQDAFTAEGLDASDYGMFISSTWEDGDGVEQTRLGVRYNELLSFIITTI